MKMKRLIAIVFALMIGSPFLETKAFYEQSIQRADIQETSLYAREDPKNKDYGKASFSFQHGVRSDEGKTNNKGGTKVKRARICTYKKGINRSLASEVLVVTWALCAGHGDARE